MAGTLKEEMFQYQIVHIREIMSVYLEHYAGQQSHNVYPEDLLVHYAKFSFVAKTSGSISDINMWLYQGDEKEGENLWFGLRPNGSDNPGLNISGFGVEESMSPNFNVGEWIVSM